MIRLTFAFVFLFNCALAQDTITIYFEFGSSRIENGYNNIGPLISQYDIASLDSVQFIGYADSVGNFAANLRLSRKRARNTAEHCKPYFSEVPVTSIFARGENAKGNDSLSRRVEIVLFYSNESLYTTTEIIEDADPRCFLVDFEALQFCNIQTVTKKKKEYIRLEAMDVALFSNRQHYYAIKDKNGKVSVLRLRWKEKTTGRLWWKKKRLVAEMPKASFEQFQFFTLQNAPCSGCSETIFTLDTIIMTYSMFYPDYFVMDNMQAKIRFFGDNQVKIRVPKEYINTAEDYYASPGVQHYHNSPITWETKKMNKKQDYYYAKLDIIDNRFPIIKQQRMTTVCQNDYEYSDRFAGGWDMRCGGVFGWELGLQVNLSPGAFYHNDTLTGFLALGVSYSWDRAFVQLQAGINTRPGFYGNMGYQFSFFNFPLRALSLANSWESPAFNKPIDKYGRVYAGTDLRTSFNQSYQSFIEGNIHLGTAFERTTGNVFFPRFYVHGGIGYDLLQRVNNQPYPFVQVGLTINLNPFFPG